MHYDLKITGGTIIDGSGQESRQASVGIKDGLIVEVGACEGTATQEIDATGMMVTPGFIDLHTHYDGQVTWDAQLSPSCYHGVTTAIMGNCGVGFAPVRPTDHQRLIDLMQGVEDIPGTALAEGITWNWESFPEYMDAIDTPHTMDFLVQMPHDALRVYVMGDRAIASEAATPEELEQMRQLTREALQAGALGFSTGRTDNHRAVDGSETPSSEANVRELRAIASALDGLDHGVLQAVSDFDMVEDLKRFDPEYDVLEQMVEASGGHPMSLSLIQRVRDTEQWKKIIARSEKAVEKGHNIRLQVGARGIGVLLGLEATFHPFMGFPSYKKISHLSLAERVERMSDPAFKAQLLTEESEKVSGDGSSIPPLADEFLAHLDFVAMRLYRLGENFSYEPSPQESILAEAYRTDKPPLEVIYDAMLQDDGHELLYFPIYNYMEQNLDAVHTMLTHPLALPGLSDGGAHVGTVCDASFPTYMLTHWSRDRDHDRIPLERVVQMMTQDVAQYIGLKDRGEIKVGMRADINVIQYDTLRLKRPYMVQDLPAGGQRLLQEAVGYHATLVAGELVLKEDALTGALPGRLVRMGQ